jgi:signal transduction histidine kinase
VIVSPYVKTRSGKPVTMPIEEKAIGVGFKRVYPFQRKVFAEASKAQENLTAMASFVDAEERHKIGREIHVFRK